MPATARALAYGPDAVFVTGTGQVVLVPGGAPGDFANITNVHFVRGAMRGVLGEIAAPGRSRVEPPCPFVAAGCGGCQWQHVAYSEQVNQKSDILQQTIERVGRVTSPTALPALLGPSPWNYRSAIQFHITDDGEPALMGWRGETAVPIDACKIADPLLNRLLATLRTPLAQAILRDPSSGIRELTARVAHHNAEDALAITMFSTGDRPRPAQRLATLIDQALPLESAWLVREAGRASATHTPPVLLHGATTSTDVVDGRPYLLGAQTFFQANAATTQMMVQVVRSEVRQRRPRFVVDLYCGAGLFALALVDLVPDLLGIDANRQAIELARQTLEHVPRGSALRHGQVRFLQRDLTRHSIDEMSSAELVIADPPRAGLATRVIPALIGSRASTLIYVSCDPSSLARDAGKLVAGGWSLSSTRLVDAFPQTFHIESISVFTRTSNNGEH